MRPVLMCAPSSMEDNNGWWDVGWSMHSYHLISSVLVDVVLLQAVMLLFSPLRPDLMFLRWLLTSDSTATSPTFSLLQIKDLSFQFSDKYLASCHYFPSLADRFSTMTFTKHPFKWLQTAKNQLGSTCLVPYSKRHTGRPSNGSKKTRLFEFYLA